MSEKLLENKGGNSREIMKFNEHLVKKQIMFMNISEIKQGILLPPSVFEPPLAAYDYFLHRPFPKASPTSHLPSGLPVKISSWLLLPRCLHVKSWEPILTGGVILSVV